MRDRYKTLARQYIAEGKTAKAVTFFQSALNESRQLSSTQLYYASDLVDIAQAKIQEKQLDEAIRYLNNARDIFNSMSAQANQKQREEFYLDSSLCYRTTWRCFIEMHDYDKATACLKQAQKFYDGLVHGTNKIHPILRRDADECASDLTKYATIKTIGTGLNSPKGIAVASVTTKPSNTYVLDVENKQEPPKATCAETTALTADTEGLALHAASNFVQAEVAFRKAVQAQEQCLSNSDEPSSSVRKLKLAGYQQHLADALFCQGKATDSLHYYQQALPVIQKLDSEPGQDYCLRQTAKAAFAAGSYKQASELFSYAFKLEEKMHASKDTLADSMTNIAECMARLGDKQNAIEMRTRAAHILKSNFP